MENFISIIKCNSAVASYYVSKDTNAYTAHLMKNSEGYRFPEEVTIHKNKTLLPLTNEPDVVTEKLVNAIKLAVEKEEGSI